MDGQSQELFDSSDDDVLEEVMTEFERSGLSEAQRFENFRGTLDNEANRVWELIGDSRMGAWDEPVWTRSLETQPGSEPPTPGQRTWTPPVSLIDTSTDESVDLNVSGVTPLDWSDDQTGPPAAKKARGQDAATQTEIVAAQLGASGGEQSSGVRRVNEWGEIEGITRIRYICPQCGAIHFRWSHRDKP